MMALWPVSYHNKQREPKNLQISFSVIEYFTDFTILLHKAEPEKKIN